MITFMNSKAFLIAIHAWTYLATSTTISASNQVPFSDRPQSFIETSIFGRRQNVFVKDHDEFTVKDSFTEDTPYEGIATFAHLNWTNCYNANNDNTFDIGIVGAPFDLGVTYRPGARFGPAGARMGARRLSPSMGYR